MNLNSRSLLIVCLLFASILGHSQASTGPNSPSAAVNGGGGSGSVPAWTLGLGNPYTSNNGYAAVINQIKNKNTDYLHVTGFGFSIPAGSYVAGITVEVEMFGTVPTGASNSENSILLLNSAGARVGIDHSTFATLATTDLNTYVTYGSSSDNWGGVLTYADINSADFGVALQYRSGNINDTPGNYDFYVDHVRVTITYTAGFDAVIDGCFNDGATWGRVSPGVAGIDYPDATIAASIPGGRTVTVCAGSAANCFALIINSTLSTTAGAILTLANSTSSLNVSDDVLMQTTTSASASFASGTINLNGGSLTAIGDLFMTADQNGGNVTTQAIVFGGGTLTINGSSITMGGDHVSATTTLNMNAANSVLNLAGDLSMGTGASLTNGGGTTGTVNYKGASAQIVRSALTYFNLTFSGGGEKNLEGATSVLGTLNMISGNCNLGPFTLTLGSSVGAPGTLARTGGIIYTLNSGAFVRWFSTATIADGGIAGLFPVGTSVDYRPFSVYFPALGPSTGGTLSMIHTDPGTIASIVSFADGASTVVRRTNMSWLLTAANGFDAPATRLHTRIEGTNIGTVGNVNDLRVTLVGSVIGTAGVNGGTVSNPIVRRTLLPAFTAASNTFYIGSVDAVSSPLPIELIDFRAEILPAGVRLVWETASELNNDFFTIERSISGESFSGMAEINGHGTTNNHSLYQWIDTNPLSGTSYYRLKQTDFDGAFSYSKIIKVLNAWPQSNLSIYPNPVSRVATLEIGGLTPYKQATIEIMNTHGKVINSVQHPVDQFGMVKLPLDFSSTARGIYLVRVNFSLAKPVNVMVE